MYQIYFILEWHSTCFRRSFRPSTGVQDCTYSNRHLSNRYCCMFASKQTAVCLTVAVCTVMNFWWRMERPCETRGVSFQNKINFIHWCVWLVLLQKQVPTCDKWVPVTTAWRVLRLQMEEGPPIRRVAANILKKQSPTADEGWSSSLGVGRGATNASPWKNLFRNIHKARCFLWKQNNPEVKYFPTRISGGGVFLKEVSHSRKRDILLGTWNVRSLYRGDGRGMWHVWGTGEVCTGF